MNISASILVKLGIVYTQLVKKLIQWANPEHIEFLEYYADILQAVTQTNVEEFETNLSSNKNYIFVKKLVDESINLFTLNISKNGHSNINNSKFPGVGRTLAGVGPILSSPAIIEGYNLKKKDELNLGFSQSLKNFEKKAINKHLTPLLTQLVENQTSILADNNKLNIDASTVENVESSNTYEEQNPNADGEQTANLNINPVDLLNGLVSLDSGDTIICSLKFDILEQLYIEFKSKTKERIDFDEIFEWERLPTFSFSMFTISDGSDSNECDEIRDMRCYRYKKLLELDFIERINIKDFNKWKKLCDIGDYLEEKNDEIQMPETLSLYDCFSEFIKKEQLSEQDSWYCSGCKEFSQAIKKLDLWRLPEILIIHLKRFDHLREWSKKLDTFVDFPLEGLDLNFLISNNKYFSEESQHKADFLGPNSVYDLYATCNHYGGYGGGHYTASALHSGTNEWYNYNDSNVTHISDPLKEVVTTSAYVLFYRLRSANSTKHTPGELSEIPIFSENQSLLNQILPYERLLMKKTPASLKIFELVKNHIISKDTYLNIYSKLEDKSEGTNRVNQTDSQRNSDPSVLPIYDLKTQNVDPNTGNKTLAVMNKSSLNINTSDSLFEIDTLYEKLENEDEEMCTASSANSVRDFSGLKHQQDFFSGKEPSNDSNSISKKLNLTSDNIHIDAREVLFLNSNSHSKNYNNSKVQNEDDTETDLSLSILSTKLHNKALQVLSKSKSNLSLSTDNWSINQTVTGKLMGSSACDPTSSLPNCTVLSPVQLFRSKSTNSKIYQEGINAFINSDSSHLNNKHKSRSKTKHIP
ncbi:hypothetical protein BB561_001383 [Smittium simulii]|uniref:ubiquitinyl hydrolase 1 n=1 Tax=Smittium simulii TaxID=133385 RepID=A0A2T9YUT3_9FUNG|nr:hypothetical protein BB561_001383 [Smittium simulii]